MLDVLGEGYTEAVRDAYLYKVPKSVDFVMYWWYKAAKAVRGKLDGWENAGERFGFVSTNSITQTLNRKVVQKQDKASPPVSLTFAIPDHPWVASKDGSDVRIAMTVGAVTDQPGTLQTVMREEQSKGIHWEVELEEQTGNILPDLTIGADVTGAEALEANSEICFRGFNPVGRGFVVGPDKAQELGLGEIAELDKYLKPYIGGKDLTQRPRDVMIIDLHGLEKEQVRDRFPKVYQHVKENVKPERDQNKEKYRRENWWLFGRPSTNLRAALEDLDRFIATPYVSKHRFFQFLSGEYRPDDGLVNIAIDDAYPLGVLSSRIHIVWSLAAGGRLGVGNDPRYNNTQCFDPYPFPAATENQKATIRELGEQLDQHRKERLDQHDDLTMTALYNVLKKERRNEDLDKAEREIHEKGLVGVLKELHDELDAAVARAYGWEPGLSEEEILQKLVDLNAERRAEEEEGHVRYVRPDRAIAICEGGNSFRPRPEYQAPETVETQAALELEGPESRPLSGDGAPADPESFRDERPYRFEKRSIRTIPTPALHGPPLSRNWDSYVLTNR